MRLMHNKLDTIQLHKRRTLVLLAVSQGILMCWGHRDTRGNPEAGTVECGHSYSTIKGIAFNTVDKELQHSAW